MTNTLYLIGFMGAGKTTVGKLLADRLKTPFYDLDEEIERDQNQPIPSIFSASGEAYFRQVEKTVLKKIKGPAVISTGGGILFFEDTAEWMNRHGTVIYLTAPFDELYERIKGDPNRPVAKERSKESLFQLYTARTAAYEAACTAQVSVSDRSPEATAEEILSLHI